MNRKAIVWAFALIGAALLIGVLFIPFSEPLRFEITFPPPGGQTR